MVGQKLGHYRLTAEIGAGGMGAVYRARDEHLDRDVAIKVLPRDAFADESARRRFRTEALALARLSSPHIAHVHDFTSEAGVDFLVMELVPGRSLAETLDSGALPERAVLKLGAQIALALEEAHAHGVVHRDLKPGNIMVTPKGELKVLDFGLAKLTRETAPDASTASAAASGSVAGTVPYMAPEQLLGKDVDGRTDVWAFGAVLYELVSGQRPFRGQTLASVTDAILNKPPDPLKAHDLVGSPGLDAVVRKCLEKDPDRRYQSAREVRVDLERLLTPSMQAVGAPASRGARRLWWVAAAVVLAGALGSLAWLAPWRPRGGAVPAGAGIESLAVLPLENMTGDSAQEYFSDGMTEALITELARTRSLKVISRASVMRFKRSGEPVSAIARQLGVKGIITGSVMRSGGRVRVTAQLIRADADAHLWADSFDRQEPDILALQSDVAQAIVSEVRGALAPEASTLTRARKRVKPESYDLVLQGSHLLASGGDPASFKRATSLFEQAVALDPASAEAHAGLARALMMSSQFGVAGFWDVEPRIRREVDAALALDENCATAQTVLGDLRWSRQDPAGAVEALRRAVDLDPGNAVTLATYAAYVSRIENGPEIERLLVQAVDMDPLAQVVRCAYKDWLYNQRRYADAENQARKTLDLDPNWFWAWDQLWRIHALQGKLDDAQDESRRAWKVAFGDGFDPPSGLSWQSYDQWLDRFLAAQPQSWVSGFRAANAARRGETRKALDLLQAAERDNGVFLLLLDWPDFDPIREEPGFRRIVENRKLPVESFCRLPTRQAGPK